LGQHNYVIIPDFISEDFQAALREDVHHLRSQQQYFKQARIGQDATNALNQNIRVAETCFLSSLPPSDSSTTSSSFARQQLLQLLQQLPQDLMAHANVLSHDTAKTRHIPTRQLDTSPISITAGSTSLHEWLYAYYPQGGFYRRHVDALPGSASTLRCYSLLLYLNDNEIYKSKDDHGGQLRLHL
jgi:Rps23 Pro-64 3,4-dihydroxylase Tpa1-like proline 4-hydroxylase